MRSDSCAASVSALDVRNAWPRMFADSSTRNAGRACAALDPGERARRARIEHRDPHVGGNLIEPIAQRAIRVAILAEQQALLVGVPGVVQQHLGAAAARRAPRLGDARGHPVERVDHVLEPRLAQDDGVGGADAAELDEHLREALGVGDRVLEARPLGAAAGWRQSPARTAARGAARRSSPAATPRSRASPAPPTRAVRIASSWPHLFLYRERGLLQIARQRQRRRRRAQIPRGGAARRLDDRHRRRTRAPRSRGRTAPTPARRRARRPRRAGSCRRREASRPGRRAPAGAA